MNLNPNAKPPRASSFAYYSNCCNALAKKDPCERSKSDIKDGKFSECGLGKWYCGICKHKTKVSRRKYDSKV